MANNSSLGLLSVPGTFDFLNTEKGKGVYLYSPVELHRYDVAELLVHKIFDHLTGSQVLKSCTVEHLFKLLGLTDTRVFLFSPIVSERQNIRRIIASMANDPNCDVQIVHIDGFSVGSMYPLASITPGGSKEVMVRNNDYLIITTPKVNPLDMEKIPTPERFQLGGSPPLPSYWN